MTRCMLCALQKNGKKNASEQHSREKVSQGYSGHGAQVRAAYASRSGQFFWDPSEYIGSILAQTTICCLKHYMWRHFDTGT